MSRIGRQPIPVPAGVTVAIEPELVTVNGPKGELSERIHRDITVEQDGRDGSIVTRPDRPRRAPRAARPDAHAGRQHGRRRHRRLREAPGDPGRRLPRALKGRDLELALGYSHPVSIKAPEGIEFEVPQPTRITVRGASKQQVGEIAAHDPQAAQARALQGQGHPLRGRVRRPEGWQARMTVQTKPAARLQAPPPRPRQGPRHRRASADLGVPFQPRHLRTADRRRRRPHAGRRQLDRGRPARRSSRCEQATRPASCWPSAPRRPASTRPCSIAAATSTTGASRRSPTARARAA